jgi:signal recognition particle receptor subunit beta
MNNYKEFNTWTLEEFNRLCDTNILPTDKFQKIVDKLEKEEINYFYISMNKEDVLEAIEAEKEIAEALDLRLLYIEEIGIYIATY